MQSSIEMNTNNNKKMKLRIALILDYAKSFKIQNTFLVEIFRVREAWYSDVKLVFPLFQCLTVMLSSHARFRFGENKQNCAIYYYKLKKTILNS